MNNASFNLQTRGLITLAFDEAAFLFQSGKLTKATAEGRIAVLLTQLDPFLLNHERDAVRDAIEHAFQRFLKEPLRRAGSRRISVVH